LGTLELKWVNERETLTFRGTQGPSDTSDVIGKLYKIYLKETYVNSVNILDAFFDINSESYPYNIGFTVRVLSPQLKPINPYSDC